MQVELVTDKIIPAWIELAREVEPLFEGSMAEDEGFHEFMERKVRQTEALMVRDAENSDELMGLLAYSRNNNAISWFAVFERYRGRGVGSQLLKNTLDGLDQTREISVTTFREENRKGLPARRIFQQYGFADFDANAFFDGHPRCIMKRPPNT